MITTQSERVAIRKIAAGAMIAGRCRKIAAYYLPAAIHAYTHAQQRTWDQRAVYQEVLRHESQPNTAALKRAAFWD